MSLQRIGKRDRVTRSRKREIEEIIKNIRFDVMGIILSNDSPDVENAYDVGYRDAVDELKLTVGSYFRQLTKEMR